MPTAKQENANSSPSISRKKNRWLIAMTIPLMAIFGWFVLPKPVSAIRAPSPPELRVTPLRFDFPVEQHRLDNGLRIVLQPDHTVPTVAIAVYYDVGSRNEVQGRSGFAHLFEHMMFQGSANVAKGQHMELIETHGGDMNGTTSEDRTNYFETLPSNELALGLWLEADRMRSLAVTQENFENQRQVVMDERRQSYENRAYMLSFLRANELAYQGYWPYEHSTIGEMIDLENAPLSAVQAFWTQYYGPNNAVLSIAGDFEPAQALELIRTYFGSIASRPVPAYAPPDLPAQTAERTDTVTDALATLPAFHVSYAIPTNRHTDHYALELLANILGDGESSRLYRRLVHERAILSQISVGTDDRRGPDLFSMFAILSEGHTAREARTAIENEIVSIQQNGITERELLRARNQMRSGFAFGLQGNLQRAMNLAEFEMYFGDATLLRNELDRYLAVTREDIQRVATQYLVARGRTVLDVVPAASAAAQGGAE